MQTQKIQNIIDEAENINHHIENVFEVKSGKEATVYRVELNGKLAAMKIYKNPEERSFKNTTEYLAGRFYKKASHRKAIAKKNRFSQKLKHDNWIKREFFMLEKLYTLGAKIPKPVLQIDDAIFMEFLGDENNSAPRLCDIELSKNEAKKVFEEIIKTLLIFWNFGIVHADLSAYNILWWNHTSYIIDFPQSIDRRTHPNTQEILDRDLQNLAKYFEKYIQIGLEKIRSRFK